MSAAPGGGGDVGDLMAGVGVVAGIGWEMVLLADDDDTYDEDKEAAVVGMAAMQADGAKDELEAAVWVGEPCGT